MARNFSEARAGWARDGLGFDGPGAGLEKSGSMSPLLRVLQNKW